MYWKKRIILLVFFCNIALADESQQVTPIINKYPKNAEVRINVKQNIVYDNVDRRLDKAKKLNLIRNQENAFRVQTLNPYFVRVEVGREANSDLSNTEIAQAVTKDMQKVPASQEKAIKEEINKSSETSKNNNREGFFAKLKGMPEFLKSLLQKPGADEVASRPLGHYRGIFASFMIAGTANISGNEQRPTGSVNTPWSSYDTFSTSKLYLPSGELGLFLGWHLYSFMRAQLDVSWTYLYGNIGSISSSSQSPGSSFTLPNDSFNGNLFASTFNFYFDPYKNLRIWPSIGVGAGVAMFTFNGYNNLALLYPVINIYAGFNFMLPDKKEVISIGYKLQWIWTGTTSNQSPVVDNNSAITGLTNNRPTNEDNSIFSGILIHKIEIAIRLY